MSVPTIHNNERTAIRVNLFKPSSNYIKRLTLNNNIKITQKFPISPMYNKKYVSLAFMSYSRCQNKKEIVKSEVHPKSWTKLKINCLCDELDILSGSFLLD